MKAWKNKTWAWDIEGLSLHSYTVVKWPPAFKATGFGESEYAAILKATLNMESLVSTHSAVMDRYDPDRKIALVVDEWGAWLAPTPGSPEGFLEQQNSQRDALVAALNINIFARHAARVRAANIAQMVNVLQAMIFTRQEKMVLTPTYHVFHMYVPFQDATLVPLQFEPGAWKSGDVELPRVDAIAARDAAGKLWVALTNLDPGRAARVAFTVAGKGFTRAQGQILVAPKIDSVNSFEAPAVVAPKPYTAKVAGKQVTAELAPASITVMALE
jgi:alpha-N-arabinofuranosidase